MSGPPLHWRPGDRCYVGPIVALVLSCESTEMGEAVLRVRIPTGDEVWIPRSLAELVPLPEVAS